jgi:ferrous iron transport protein A
MRLQQIENGQSCHIVSCGVTGKTKAKLDSLGLVKGESVTVLSSNFAGLIVEVKGSRLALGHEVAAEFEVV